jgi:hypothetical protein
MRHHYRVGLASLELTPPAQSEAARVLERRRKHGQIVGNPFWQEIIRNSNRARRRSLIKGVFLSAAEFCERRRISHERLRWEERSLDVFSVTIEHREFYPALLADRRYNRRRIAKICHRLGPFMPGMSKWGFLEARQAPLMAKTALEAVHRGGPLFSRALDLAGSEAEDWLPPELRRRYAREEADENRGE